MAWENTLVTWVLHLIRCTLCTVSLIDWERQREQERRAREREKEWVSERGMREWEWRTLLRSGGHSEDAVFVTHWPSKSRRNSEREGMWKGEEDRLTSERERERKKGEKNRERERETARVRERETERQRESEREWERLTGREKRRERKSKKDRKRWGEIFLLLFTREKWMANKE